MPENIFEDVDVDNVPEVYNPPYSLIARTDSEISYLSIILNNTNEKTLGYNIGQLVEGLDNLSEFNAFLCDDDTNIGTTNCGGTTTLTFGYKEEEV